MLHASTPSSPPGGIGLNLGEASPGLGVRESGAGSDEVLGPVVAGAHARGVADALHALGRAAVLLDGTGRVLHAAAEAERLLGPAIKVSRGCLIGSDQASREWVDDVLSRALGTRSNAAGAAGPLPRLGGLVASVARIPAVDALSSMRVSAILLLCQTEP